MPLWINLTSYILQVSVCLDPSWTVQQIKTTLAPKLKRNSHDIRIIFAGKELPDNMVIQQCDLGNHSFLHAVTVVAKEDGAANSTSDPAGKGTTISHINETSNSSSSPVVEKVRKVLFLLSKNIE